jgi:hypothetical protein
MNHIQAKALSRYGNQNQIAQTIQELNELSVELTEFLMGNQCPNLRDKILSEIADVQICLEYPVEIFGIRNEELDDERIVKLIRLESRMKEEDRKKGL